MQSNHTKLLIAGLAAAQAVSAAEATTNQAPEPIGEPDVMPTLMAQIGDDPLDVADPHPGNANLDSDNPVGTTSTTGGTEDISEISTSDIDDKVDLLTMAAEEGLTAKSDYILQKLTMWAAGKVKEVAEIDTQCRFKLDEQYQRSVDVLATQVNITLADMNQCGKDYLKILLDKKEELKGLLQELLNETIHQMRELKVELELNDAGLVNDQANSVIDTAIAALITDFETASDLVVTADWVNFQPDEFAIYGLCITDISAIYEEVF